MGAGGGGVVVGGGAAEGLVVAGLLAAEAAGATIHRQPNAATQAGTDGRRRSVFMSRSYGAGPTTGVSGAITPTRLAA